MHLTAYWRRHDPPLARAPRPRSRSCCSPRCRSPRSRPRPPPATAAGRCRAALRPAGRSVDLSRHRHPGRPASGCSARCPTACATRCATTGVPPGQVSIRVRIDAGSLHENDSERGFAHLIEHLTFRESKYLGDGRGDPAFPAARARASATTPTRSPARRRRSTSSTCPTRTPATLEESIRLLSGMIREPALSAANLAAEVPIVLAERRERNGARAAHRRGHATKCSSPASGSPTAARSAPSRRSRARRRARCRRSIAAGTGPRTPWSSLAGDADPARLAALVEQYFGDWKVPGAARRRSPISAIRRRPRGADPANPVGETRVLVEPGQPRALSYAVLRPWQQVTDNIEYNRGLLLDAVAETIINRRLETARARRRQLSFRRGRAATRPAARPTALTSTSRR